MVAFLAEVLGAADQADLSALVAGRVCLIDGTLVPTVGWRHRTDLASGTHRRYGMNVGAPGRPARSAHRRQPSVPGELARRALLPGGRLGRAGAEIEWRNR